MPRPALVCVTPAGAGGAGAFVTPPGEVDVVQQRAGEGIAELVNRIALADGERRDVVLVTEPCEAPEGCLELLRAAAHADAGTAAACALADRGDGYTLAALARAPAVDEAAYRHAAGIEFGADGGDAGGGGEDEADEAGVVAPLPAGPGAGLTLDHPRVAVAWGPLVWLRHDALSLLGGLDGSFEHPWALLADFSARVRARGLACVMAGEVIARRAGAPLPCPESERAAIARAHPWLSVELVAERRLEPGPLRRGLVAARAAARISVTVDARALGPRVGGTQTYVGALVLALARCGPLRVRALIAHDAPDDVREAFAATGAVEVIDYAEAVAGDLPRTDVVHRPQQMFTAADERLVRLLGERVVITQQDLIAFHNPLYHADDEHWSDYRRVTRVSLAAADGVVFFTRHARDDAIAQDLIEPARATVAAIGMDDAAVGTGDTAIGMDGAAGAAAGEGPPPGASPPPGVDPHGRLLLVLGTDYLHKNRLFAIALARELRGRHGWGGRLVLAGPHVPHGSSAEQERELLAAAPELAAQVIDLGRVSEAQKRWLLAHADALLCPSTQEGFGLTPLEAAAAGTPCVYAPVGALGEVLGTRAATIVPWDAGASADRAAGLLRPGAAREEHLSVLRGAVSRATWDGVVESLLAGYRRVLQSAFRSGVPRVWEDLALEQRLAQLDEAHDRYAHAYVDLETRVAVGLPLIDRGGLLSAPQQRGLMRVAARRRLSRPLLGTLGLLGGEREPE